MNKYITRQEDKIITPEEAGLCEEDTRVLSKILEDEVYTLSDRGVFGFSIMEEGNPSVFMQSYHLIRRKEKITGLQLQGIIHPEFWNFKNIDTLTIQAGYIEYLPPRNYHYNLKNNIKLEGDELREYNLFKKYCNNLSDFSEEKYKIENSSRDILNGISNHYSPDVSAFLKPMLKNGNNTLIFSEMNSSEVYEVIHNIKSELLKKLAVINHGMRLNLPKKIGNLKNLKELNVMNYNKIFFPNEVNELSIKDLKLFAWQINGINLNRFKNKIKVSNPFLLMYKKYRDPEKDFEFNEYLSDFYNGEDMTYKKFPLK